MFSPIEQNKAFIQIAEQIRDLINKGKLKPGDRLPPERHLAETFGTSRTTVREALRALEIVGLIDSRIGQGTFIKVSSISDIEKRLSEISTQTSPLQVFDARLGLEPYLAKLAAYHATDQDIRDLEHCIGQMDGGLQDYKVFEKWDGEFHQCIAAASKNTLLIKFMSIINDVRFEKLWGSMKKRSLTEERIRHYQEEHKHILEAIKDRNSSLAEKYVYQHVLTVKNNLFN